ncbi:MAG TPA: hypothetical protein DIC22_01875 [Chitinophagaceae bacterium]|nr:hypothetical protein [Chitinophagaceae bacterium]
MNAGFPGYRIYFPVLVLNLIMGTKALIRKDPVTVYFILTFLISWTGAFLLVAGKLIHHEPVSKLDGILMFPVMLLGPSCSGILLMYVTGGKKGLKDFCVRISPKKAPGKWYPALLIPPSAILLVLVLLSLTLSKEYAPNFFLIGFLFGIPAGILEETGWMGFAFPNMSKRRSALSNSMLLGLIWGLWHLPVINFLGTASPHGTWWFPYFLSFVLVMTAMRVIIAWVYCNTESVFLSQLMHISSTGFLVILSPSPMTVQHEPVWYVAYAIALWTCVLFITAKWSKNLVKKKKPENHRSLIYDSGGSV